MKNIRFFLYENSHFLVVKFSVHSNRYVYVFFFFRYNDQDLDQTCSETIYMININHKNTD